MPDQSCVHAEHKPPTPGVIEGREKCYLFVHETGEVELWGTKNIECRSVCIRPDVERVDYCETHHGLDYSGLRLLAWENWKPKAGLEQLFDIACDLFEAAGMEPAVAMAKAKQALVDSLGRRVPFVLNDMADKDVRAEVARELQQAELREFSEALHMTAEICSIRRKERERSLRLAEGD